MVRASRGTITGQPLRRERGEVGDAPFRGHRPAQGFMKQGKPLPSTPARLLDPVPGIPGSRSGSSRPLTTASAEATTARASAGRRVVGTMAGIAALRALPHVSRTYSMSFASGSPMPRGRRRPAPLKHEEETR